MQFKHYAGLVLALIMAVMLSNASALAAPKHSLSKRATGFWNFFTRENPMFALGSNNTRSATGNPSPQVVESSELATPTIEVPLPADFLEQVNGFKESYSVSKEWLMGHKIEASDKQIIDTICAEKDLSNDPSKYLPCLRLAKQHHQEEASSYVRHYLENKIALSELNVLKSTHPEEDIWQSKFYVESTNYEKEVNEARFLFSAAQDALQSQPAKSEEVNDMIQKLFDDTARKSNEKVLTIRQRFLNANLDTFPAIEPTLNWLIQSTRLCILESRDPVHTIWKSDSYIESIQRKLSSLRSVIDSGRKVLETHELYKAIEGQETSIEWAQMTCILYDKRGPSASESLAYHLNLLANNNTEIIDKLLAFLVAKDRFALARERVNAQSD